MKRKPIGTITKTLGANGKVSELRFRKAAKQPYQVRRAPYFKKGKDFAPNGAQEVHRRWQQIKAGQLAFWKDGKLWKYDKGWQYTSGYYPPIEVITHATSK